jgi:hypothetical protein
VEGGGALRRHEVELRHSGEGGFGIKLDGTGALAACRGAAALAGLHVGARIVAVNGKPVGGKAAILAAVHGQRVARFSVVAASAPRVDDAAARQPPPVQTARLHRVAPWAATPKCGDVQVCRVLSALGVTRGVDLQPPPEDNQIALAEVGPEATAAPTPLPADVPYEDVADAATFRRQFSVISRQSGTDRTPPNISDLQIYMANSTWAPIIPREATTERPAQRHAVPGLPGTLPCFLPHSRRRVWPMLCL